MPIRILPKSFFFQGAALLAILLDIVGLGFAQTVDVDVSSRPEVVKERARKEIEKKKEPSEKEPQIQPPPEAPLPTAPQGPSLLLRQVILKGNTVRSSAQLDFLIAPYRNRQVTVQQLQDLAQAIQREYRSRGYLTTVAFVPPQQIEEGRVVIQVLEGRLGELIIEGQRYFSATQIRREWPLRMGEVLRYQPMRRSLQRMNANPDRKVQALLRPGETTGTTNVVLKVQDRFPGHAGVFLDNEGTKSIGKDRAGWTIKYDNLFGRDHAVTLGMVGGRHFGAGFAQYDVPIGSAGTRVALSATHSQVSPRRQFKPFGVNGTSETYTAAVTQPLIVQDSVHLNLRAALDFLESRTKVLSEPSRRERLRVVRLESDVRLTDSNGTWTLGPELSFGIKGLGASSEHNPMASRTGAPPNFAKFRCDVTRAQRLPGSTQLIVSILGQLSGSKLTPQEQLYLGGATSVRGYPEGDYLADQGVVARLDYLVPSYGVPLGWRIPGVKGFLRDMLRYIFFLDKGYGRLRGATGTEHVSYNPMGVGVGLLFREIGGFTLRLEWGYSIGDRPLTDDSRSAFHFRFQRDF